MEEINEKDLRDTVDFYLGLRDMLEDLETALRGLIILASMGIWTWIVVKIAPIFNLIGKYMPEWVNFLVFMLILSVGWLFIVIKLKG